MTSLCLNIHKEVDIPARIPPFGSCCFLSLACAGDTFPKGFLSVIEKPKARGQRYQEKAAAKRGRSYKEQLRLTIDRVLPSCKDFEEFLAHMREEGDEISVFAASFRLKTFAQRS